MSENIPSTKTEAYAHLEAWVKREMPQVEWRGRDTSLSSAMFGSFVRLVREWGSCRRSYTFFANQTVADFVRQLPLPN